MKKILSKTFRATLILCTMISFSSVALTHNPMHNADHDYQNTKMKIALKLPDEWQEKVKIEETDNQVTFKYNNPGDQPVFLLAINRISEAQWLAIKDQLTNATLLSHKDGMVTYVEKTDRTKIKGINNKDFASIVSKIDEVIQSYKDV